MPAFTHALLLREGRVVTAGQKGKVLTSARLSEVFGARLRLGEKNERYQLNVQLKRKERFLA